MKPSFRNRKPTRLRYYDYSQNGGYFLTVCTKDKQCLFGSVVGDGVLDVPYTALSKLGQMVERRIQEMAGFYSHIRIDHYVVMPNHVHLLLIVQNRADQTSGPSGTPAPTNAVVPQFISAFKRLTNREAGISLWQRGYHDHIIRDQADYEIRWNYIETNPVRWASDELYMP